jgi:hypothetical protein
MKEIMTSLRRSYRMTSRDYWQLRRLSSLVEGNNGDDLITIACSGGVLVGVAFCRIRKHFSGIQYVA